MKADEVLKLLEKHESECADRYKRIEQQLDRFDHELITELEQKALHDIYNHT